MCTASTDTEEKKLKEIAFWNIFFPRQFLLLPLGREANSNFFLKANIPVTYSSVIRFFLSFILRPEIDTAATPANDNDLLSLKTWSCSFAYF